MWAKLSFSVLSQLRALWVRTGPIKIRMLTSTNLLHFWHFVPSAAALIGWIFILITSGGCWSTYMLIQ